MGTRETGSSLTLARKAAGVLEWRAMSLRASEYKHIVLDDRGRAIIEGTRMKVLDLVMAQQAHGWSAEEIAWQFQALTLAQVHGALSYYYDHQAEMDAEIRSHIAEDEQARQEQARTNPLVQKLLAQRRR